MEKEKAKAKRGRPRIMCPKGHSGSIVRIIYGEPTYEAHLDEVAGKLRLGGCCIYENSPTHYCKIHNLEFRVEGYEP